MEQKNPNHNQEFKDILVRVSATFAPREISLVVFLVGVSFLTIVGLLSYVRYIKWIIAILAYYLVSAFLFRFLIRKQTSVKTIENLYLAYVILVELVSISLIVYLAGGAEWMGAIFLLFPVVYASIILSHDKSLLVCSLVSIFYMFLVVLPYFDIIPFNPYFDLGFPLYKERKYVINNIILATFAFFLIGLAANIFTDVLKKRNLELWGMKKKLEGEREKLEDKVMTRTKELEDLTKTLEEKVKGRTKEVEEKMKEAEKFNKMAIGRELKMIELKEELERLKKAKK